MPAELKVIQGFQLEIAKIVNSGPLAGFWWTVSTLQGNCGMTASVCTLSVQFAILWVNKEDKAMATNSASKKDRLDFRVTAEFKETVSQAASLTGTSMTAFVYEAVRQYATKTIEQHERIMLNNKARDQFLEVLANPPVPNKALQKAAKKYAS